MFEDFDLNEQRAATIRQGVMRMHACCQEILKEKERSLSCQTSAIDFFKSSSGTRVSPPVLLNTGDDDPDAQPRVLYEVPPP